MVMGKNHYAAGSPAAVHCLRQFGVEMHEDIKGKNNRDRFD